ncbi:MAG TPA: prepilin-type N-terminal cleavage/methylation domain-containing protein [Clostridiales bacterium]|nr:prepilin-type N-terminal cleavage/methylation domain-containing protein [Clostridiales bacterium]
MSNDRGMTLVDVILTVAILGILLSIVMPNLVYTMTKSEHVAKEMNSKLLLSIIYAYNGEQIREANRVKNVQITSIEDITEDTIKLRIPPDFDWEMMYPIYIDSAGRGSILHGE